MQAEALSQGTVIRIENLLAGLRRSPLLHTITYVHGTRNSPNPANGRGKLKTTQKLEIHR